MSLKDAPLAACLAFTVCFLFVLAHLTVGSQRAIQLSVSPPNSMAPASLQVRIRIQPDDSDRWVAVELNGLDFYRSSAWTVEGSRVLYSWIYPDVPAGEYRVTASVGHDRITRAVDVRQIIVN